MGLCIFFLVILSFPFWHSSALTYFEEPSGSSREATWSNDNSITETIDYGDGSLARLILKSNSSDPDGPVFAYGFICTSTCDSYFLAVFILREINTSATDPQGGFPGLVWLANRDNPIRENGTLSLTSDGDLVLRDSDNPYSNVWSTGTSGKSIIGIILQDDGNLQLYSDKNTVWESFDHPTDTLLPGQKLYAGGQLTASSSAKNWSSGQYYARMTSTGFAAFVRADPVPFMYVQLMPGAKLSRGLTPSVPRILRYVMIRGCSYIQCREPISYSRPTTYAALDGENLALTIGKTNYSVRVSPDSAVGSYLYLRLGFDGHLRTYRWQRNDVLKEVYDFVVQSWDDCQYPHDCGDYGVCRGGGNCSCPKALNGLDYFSGPLPNQGCSEITPLSCSSPLDRHRLVDFGNLSYFNFINSSAAVPKLKDLKGCKQACLENCDCKAAFFKYGSNTSDGDCYLPSKILSIRANPIPGADGSNSSAFFKIQLPNSAPSLPPPRLEIPPPDSVDTSPALISETRALLASSSATPIAGKREMAHKPQNRSWSRSQNPPLIRMCWTTGPRRRAAWSFSPTSRQSTAGSLLPASMATTASAPTVILPRPPLCQRQKQLFQQPKIRFRHQSSFPRHPDPGRTSDPRYEKGFQVPFLPRPLEETAALCFKHLRLVLIKAGEMGSGAGPISAEDLGPLYHSASEMNWAMDLTRSWTLSVPEAGF